MKENQLAPNANELLLLLFDICFMKQVTLCNVGHLLPAFTLLQVLFYCFWIFYRSGHVQNGIFKFGFFQLIFFLHNSVKLAVSFHALIQKMWGGGGVFDSIGFTLCLNRESLFFIIITSQTENKE